jgi:Na+/proline symporter
MGIIGATAQVMSSHGAEQLIVQRVLACKTVADGRKALALSAVLILPLFLIFLLVGAMLWVYYRQFPIAIPIPETRSGMQANDYIYPIFMLTAVPNILKGFLIVAILSAAMSSVSSALTSLASVATMDFVKPLAAKARTEDFYLRFSKVSTIGWAALLILVAALTQHVESVLNAAFALRGLTSGALLGGLLLAVFWKKGRAVPVITGMTTSLVAMILISTFWKEKIFWPWYTLIGTLVTLVIAFGVSALTPRARAVMAESKEGASVP